MLLEIKEFRAITLHVIFNAFLPLSINFEQTLCQSGKRGTREFHYRNIQRLHLMRYDGESEHFRILFCGSRYK